MRRIISLALAVLSAVGFGWAGAGINAEQTLATYLQQIVAALVGGGSLFGAYKTIPVASAEARSDSDLANEIANSRSTIGDGEGAKLACGLNDHILQKQAREHEPSKPAAG